jgi:hypothetical protein
MTQLALALLTAAGLAACEPEAPTPPNKLSLEVAYPFGADSENPFTDPNAAFVALTAEGPGLAGGKYRVVKPYVPGGSLNLSCDEAGNCDGVPFGQGRQISVELWSKDPQSGQPSPPILARGRSIPFDFTKSSKGELAFPYVTKLNRFAPAVTANGDRAIMTGRAGQTSATVPGTKGQVVFIGGAKVAANKNNAYDPASYESFYDELVVYEPNTRELLSVSGGNPSAALKIPRAFHASAAGANYIAVVGGYTGSSGGPILTDTVEYIDKNLTVTTGEGGNPKLVFARAGASVIRMFEDEDFFLVLGGKGNTPCKDDKGNRLDCAGNIWELIHPTLGNLQQGRLSEARWNHAAVRMPGPAGGYAVLIGGEDATGVLGTFEVVQFSKEGSGKISSLDAECPDATGDNCNFFYKPLLQGLPEPRTMMGAAYIESGTYQLIYMAGGFTDLEHKKPSARLDVFDLRSGDYVGDGFALGTPRGAPMVVPVPNSYIPNEILVAGGSQTDSIHYSTAEFIFTTVEQAPGGGNNYNIQVAPVENALIGGNRALGSATALSTGHVLIGGGVGTGENGLAHQPEVQLWNPF